MRSTFYVSYTLGAVTPKCQDFSPSNNLQDKANLLSKCSQDSRVHNAAPANRLWQSNVFHVEIVERNTHEL